VLVIRKEQIEALSEAARDAFCDRAVEYLRTSFPENTEQYSGADLRAIAQLGLDRTAELGIHRQIDVFRWLNLMFALGFDFDSDPAYPWVQDILNDPGVHRDAVMPWLTERAIRYLEAAGMQEPDENE
jgi:hypothetical protein